MSQRKQDFMDALAFYGSWIGLAILGVLVAFQLHATLVFVGIRAVELPAVNRMGWNTGTIHGLSRFLYLVVGALWLLSVSFLEGYLRESQEEHRLAAHVVRLLLSAGILYGLSYGLLKLLS